MASEEETTRINTDIVEERAGGGGGGDWLQWRALAAEAAATALLVLLTCGVVCEGAGSGGEARPLLTRALGSGLVVAALVQCFDHVSGAQMNPAVTLAKALAGAVGWRAAAAEAAAQLAGAAAAGAALRALAGDGAGGCATRPQVTPPLALAAEALLALVLALANCASWDARNRCLRDSWPARIGLTVAALSLAGGELSGASMNPARSFGPALASGVWDSHWVYWAGPLLGAGAGAALYRAAWPAAPGAAPRGVPLPAPQAKRAV